MPTQALFFILFTIYFLFHPATSPPVPGHPCGLASHRKFGETGRENVKGGKFENKETRRQSGRNEPRWDIRAPWKVKNPEDLWYERPTSPALRIYWNMTNHRCDYMRFRCMKAYTTGVVCARTIEYIYKSYPNYCAMEYQNCVKTLDIWAIAYMGYCTKIVLDRNLYVDMTYEQMSNNSKLMQMYVADLGDETEFESYITYGPTEAEITTTVQYESYNVTDEYGNQVTIEPGVYATYTVRVTQSTTTEPTTTTRCWTDQPGGPKYCLPIVGDPQG